MKVLIDTNLLTISFPEPVEVIEMMDYIRSKNLRNYRLVPPPTEIYFIDKN